jgi:hypothetical protein
MALAGELKKKMSRMQSSKILRQAMPTQPLDNAPTCLSTNQNFVTYLGVLKFIKCSSALERHEVSALDPCSQECQREYCGVV